MATYAVSDIHGKGILWHKLKSFLKPEDKCYILGDLIDGGQDGYEMAKEALSDNRFIYLMGDHENLFVKATTSFHREDLVEYISMGGALTYIAWEQDNRNGDFVKKLANLPTFAKYKSKEEYIFLLSHSGWNLNDSLNPPKYPLWDRFHFYNKTMSPIPSEYIMIHGHTPIQSFPDVEEYLPHLKDKNEVGAIFYDDGLKIDIDLSPLAICVFNMDTFEEVIIRV